MFTNTKVFLMASLGILLSGMADASHLPRGCQTIGFGYNNHSLLLNDRNQQAFFLIKNRSSSPVELEHYETKEVFMSPKLHSKLDSSSWAAFATDTQNMPFKCYSQDGEITTPLNCGDVLDVCQYPKAKFALSNMGNYWVSTNKELAQVIKDTAAKGIYLKW
jgi:hypothetical protein